MSVSQGQPPRRKHGFEPASKLLRDRIRSAGETRGFAVSRLLTHWAEVVGEDIAKMALPVKIGYAKGGFGATLTVLTTGAQAPILQMQLPTIREKVNACYGYNAISRVVVTQSAPTGFAEGQVAFAPAGMARQKAGDPVATAAAKQMSSAVGDAGLRAALEALGTNVLSRTKESKG